MKKKVGVITTSNAGNGSFACNYGAALQGYALVRQLRLWGFEAYDINYISVHEYHPKQYNIITRTIKRISCLKNKELIRNKIKAIKNRKNQKINFEKFRNFIEETNLIYENGKFYSYKALENISGDFFAFITGSDVVWNPYLHENCNDEGYFLDFVPEGVHRIAYAPSIGVTVLPEKSKNNLKELLVKFDGLSIREKSGAELVKKETGLQIPVVLDPTLLVEAKVYEGIEKYVEDLPDEYILVYRFGNINHTNEKIQELSRKLKLPIIFVPSNNDGMFCPRYDFGPGEFVGAVKKAKLVLTDSFHCTIFCLIYHTPFLTFYRTVPTEGRDINSRMIDLLISTKLEKRLVKPDDIINYESLFDIDFEVSDFIIKKQREYSVNYLKKSLELDI